MSQRVKGITILIDDYTVSAYIVSTSIRPPVPNSSPSTGSRPQNGPGKWSRVKLRTCRSRM